MDRVILGVVFLVWAGSVSFRAGLFSAENYYFTVSKSFLGIYSVDGSFGDNFFELKLLNALINDFSSSVIDLSPLTIVASIAGSSNENSFSSAVVFNKSGCEILHISFVLSSSSWKEIMGWLPCEMTFGGFSMGSDYWGKIECCWEKQLTAFRLLLVFSKFCSYPLKFT